MEKLFKWVMILIIAFMASIVFMNWIMYQDSKAFRESMKYNRCLTAVVQAIPDPNDTEGRAKFLQDCEN